MEHKRESAVQQYWYESGGAYFRQWCEAHYRTHNGVPLHWRDPFFSQFVEIVGNPWFERLTVLKAAQLGYTEVSVALCLFGAIALRSSSFFCVERVSKLMDIVGPRFQPCLDSNDLAQDLRREVARLGRPDTDNRSRLIQIGGASIYFGASNRVGASKREVTSQISSVPVSFLAVADEAESQPPGIATVLSERFSASELPTSIVRLGSTPGGEGGPVDLEVQRSRHYFDWHFTCPECDRGQFLYPLGDEHVRPQPSEFAPYGNLFKPREFNEEGKTTRKYLDENGHPYDWWAHDDSSYDAKIETAYLGCRWCGAPISKELIASGEYRCRHTKERAINICQRAIAEQKGILDSAVVTMPRLASEKFDPVVRLKNLLSTRRVADAWQQGYGVIFSLGGGAISIGALIQSIARPVPDWADPDRPDLIVVGADQGGTFHQVVVQYWYFPDVENTLPSYDLKTTDGQRKQQQHWQSAFKQVVWWGEVSGMDGIEEVARSWRADLVGMDRDPEKSAASKFAARYTCSRESRIRKTRASLVPRGRGVERSPDWFDEAGVVFTFDQVVQSEDIRRRKKKVSGVEISEYAIDRTFGLDAVRSRVNGKNLSLPSHWRWDPSDRDSYLYQMVTSERMQSGHEAIWREPPAEPDHAHHADNFAEMAVLAFDLEPRPRSFSFGSISM